MSDLKYLAVPTDPFAIDIDLEEGTMPHATRRQIRRASDMRGYYQNEQALQDLIDKEHDPLHYEVLEFPVPEEPGHLMFCVSRLQPGKVGDEFFMTKGHYHAQPQTGEIYLCLRGEGYMMMKNSDGRWVAEPMRRGSMVYVPPCWGHRSINTGTEPLVSYCVYPADAGHNYGDIQQEGFPRRIFCRHHTTVIA
jgi:glucose-6-phosphate isomerase